MRAGHSGTFRTAAAALAVLVTVALGGCGGDDGGGKDEGSGTPTSPSSEGPSSDATSDAGDPSGSAGSAEPAVDAATGPVIAYPHAEINVPAGWSKPKSTYGIVTSSRSKEGSSVSLSELQSGGTAKSLKWQANFAIQGYGTPPPKVQPTVEINGVECYHLAGKTSSATYVEEFGVIYRGYIVVVDFQFDPRLPRAERQGTIDSVLASMVWK
jgi:hypothetical protein